MLQLTASGILDEIVGSLIKLLDDHEGSMQTQMCFLAMKSIFRQCVA